MNKKTIILDGKKIRDEIAQKLKAEISSLKMKPAIAVIQIGDLLESNTYIRQKRLFAERVGAAFEHVRLSKNIKEQAVLNEIRRLNNDKSINGIILQMPIPKHLNRARLIDAILPIKDVDGLTATNFKKMWEADSSGLVPATAKGIIRLLKYYKISLKGKNVLIIGRSLLVGKPTAALLLNENATVTVAHSQSAKLSNLTKSADILIVATGVPKLISKKHVISGQVVIDVGINVGDDEGQRLVGDVDIKRVLGVVSAITPVPGGIGPMTVASLFENVMNAYYFQNVKLKK